MNILFLYTTKIDPEKGGVQRVTSLLGAYFSRKGYSIHYLATNKNSFNDTSSDQQYYLPSRPLISLENRQYYIKLLKDKNINIVINQAALGGKLVWLCSLAKQYTEVSVIAVVHNSILGTVNNYFHTRTRFLRIIPIKALINVFENNLTKFILKSIYYFKYAMKYRKLYQQSDHIVLLSQAYKPELEFFIRSDKKNKIKSIPNPSLFQNTGGVLRKENICLFVGRIDIAQKRVDRLINIWSKISLVFKGWKLDIIGDGPDRKELEAYCVSNRIERVAFHGFQDPVEFYKKSKIFCMTSSFEGFPMVLVEAQAYGVVPIAFNSYAAAEDVITSGYNGCLVKNNDEVEYSKSLHALIKDSKNLSLISENCIYSVNKFNIDVVGEIWIDLFNVIK